jgi:hypothetical protein
MSFTIPDFLFTNNISLLVGLHNWDTVLLSAASTKYLNIIYDYIVS